MYVIETKNRITFRTYTWHHLQLLTPETMKLLGSTKSKMTTNRNGENAPSLEITHDYQQNSRVSCS